MNKGKIIIRVAAALLVLVLTGCASALHQSGYYRNQIDPQYPGSDFMRVDQEVLKMSGRQNVSMEQLADQLGAIAATDWEKARAIHTWIVRNLEFDRRAFTQELEVSCDADDVLSERKTLSCGYAALFQRLAEELGLESELIQGYVKDSRYEGFDTVANNHAWNIVTIDGQSAIIDTAWAAGQARDDDFSKDYDEYYFNPPPQQLIFSHYPEQQARQLLDEPLSREEYFRLPQIPPHAFDRGVNLSLILERTRDGKTITMPIFYEVDNPYYLEEFPMVDSIMEGERLRLVIKAPEDQLYVVNGISTDVVEKISGRFVYDSRVGQETVTLYVRVGREYQKALEYQVHSSWIPDED